MQILQQCFLRMFLSTPSLISSKRSMFLTSCSGLNFDSMYIIIYILLCGLLEFSCFKFLTMKCLILKSCVSPRYDLQGWLSVKGQLLTCLLFCQPRTMSYSQLQNITDHISWYFSSDHISWYVNPEEMTESRTVPGMIFSWNGRPVRELKW